MTDLIVLIVDDEPIQRLALCSFVEDGGYNAIEAANADEAFAVLEARNDIRVMLTNIEMPGSMDGLELASAVRNRWPLITVIIVSGHFRASAGDVPIDIAFLSKPVNPLVLLNAMEHVRSPQ